jgi:hypothetical protein
LQLLSRPSHAAGRRAAAKFGHGHCRCRRPRADVRLENRDYGRHAVCARLPLRRTLSGGGCDTEYNCELARVLGIRRSSCIWNPSEFHTQIDMVGKVRLRYCSPKPPKHNAKLVRRSSFPRHIAHMPPLGLLAGGLFALMTPLSAPSSCLSFATPPPAAPHAEFHSQVVELVLSCCCKLIVC